MHKIGHVVVVVLLGLILASSAAFAVTHYHDFVIKETSYTRLCNTKKILTVNGLFPGPTIYARKHDTLIVRVHNQADYNITLHWHGVSQPRNPWSDGPEFVTQCPIRRGAKFTYTIYLSHEEGTVWWHAHSDWSRGTVYGAFVVYPEIGRKFPFPTPYKDIPILLGEWWNTIDVNEVLEDAQRTGGAPVISDAYTINGQPGDLYPCSRRETFTINVVHGKTYLLRLINAALNDELFFAVAGHNLTVVGTDGSYLKPFTTDYLMITPGQTMDLLLHAKASTVTNQRFYMAAGTYESGKGIEFDNTTTTAIIQYRKTTTTASSPPAILPPLMSIAVTKFTDLVTKFTANMRSLASMEHPVNFPTTTTTSSPALLPPLMPILPATNDTDAATKFTANLRSLASKEHPVNVPTSIDQRIIMTVSFNLLPCPKNNTCTGPGGKRTSSSLNNITFVTPPIDVLQAYYRKIRGVYNTNFPVRPPHYFNFTGDDLPPSLLISMVNQTEVKFLEYNSSVEIVFQGTSLVTGENHPMHLHGYSFYVVGSGFGNYDEKKDPSTYNLVDPPFQNTVGFPKNGWTAIRFRATNPGVWFLHCHLEIHATWGMNTILIVKNGPTRDTQMLPPPFDMPPCS